MRAFLTVNLFTLLICSHPVSKLQLVKKTQKLVNWENCLTVDNGVI